jgi:hypothetical protein
MEMSNHNKIKTRTFARPTKSVTVSLTDDFEVGENVYDAMLYHMKQCVESGDLTGWDFHVFEYCGCNCGENELPSDGVLT